MCVYHISYILYICILCSVCVYIYPKKLYKWNGMQLKSTMSVEDSREEHLTVGGL